MHPYIDANTNPLDEYYADAAAKGPHAHWSPFDLHLEGSRYQGLHGIVSNFHFDAEAAAVCIKEIEALAYGYAWGQADSYLADKAHSEASGTDGLSDEDELVNQISREGLFGGYTETEYFDYVFKSETILKDASATPEARALISDLGRRVMTAFELGRDACMEESEPSTTVSP